VIGMRGRTGAIGTSTALVCCGGAVGGVAIGSGWRTPSPGVGEAIGGTSERIGCASTGVTGGPVGTNAAAGVEGKGIPGIVCGVFVIGCSIVRIKSLADRRRGCAALNVIDHRLALD
jgi:hypothetical protein